MKRIIPVLIAVLFIPLAASAAPTSWDFANGILQPLLSQATAQIKGARFTATSTTASIFPYATTTVTSATLFCLTGDSCIATWPTSGSGGTGTATSSFAASNGISLSTTASAITYSLDNTFDKGFFFSTTSTDWWKTQNNFFATTSTDFWQTQRNFFSTTSASNFLLLNQTAAFATTSASYFLNLNKSLAFATTSADFWKTQNNFFATTSADYLATQRNYFSTTSASNFLSLNQSLAFATTSADFWQTQRIFFSTTSVTYFINASTTIPKTYSANTFTALQTFSTASTSALIVSGPATSTFGNGISLLSGCITMPNGACLGSGGSGSPGGSDTQIQYNNGGAFGASSALTFTNGNTLTAGDGTDAGFFLNSTNEAIIASAAGGAIKIQGGLEGEAGLTLQGAPLILTTGTGFGAQVDTSLLTSTKTFTLPDQSGTLCIVGVACDGGGGGGAFPFTTTINFGAITNATTTALWAQNGLFASTTNNGAPSFAVGSSTEMSFLINSAGNIGVGTAAPTAKFSIAAGHYDYQRPLFDISTTTDQFSTIFSVRSTSTKNGITGARVSVGTTSIASSYWPFFVNGSMYSTSATLRCENVGAVLGLTADSTFIQTCGDFSFDEDSTAATPAINLPTMYTGAGFLTPIYTGATAAYNVVSAAGSGGAIVANGASRSITASSSPAFEALVAAQSYQASSTVFFAGLGEGSIGADYGPSDATIASYTGMFFIATSGQSNWIAMSKPYANLVTQYRNTGVSSTTATTSPQKLTIISRKEIDNLHAVFLINGNVVADITHTGSMPLASAPVLNPRVSVGVQTNAGLAKSILIGYIRTWWNLPNYF